MKSYFYGYINNYIQLLFINYALSEVILVVLFWYVFSNLCINIFFYVKLTNSGYKQACRVHSHLSSLNVITSPLCLFELDLYFQPPIGV